MKHAKGHFRSKFKKKIYNNISCRIDCLKKSLSLYEDITFAKKMWIVNAPESFILFVEATESEVCLVTLGDFPVKIWIVFIELHR